MNSEIGPKNIPSEKEDANVYSRLGQNDEARNNVSDISQKKDNHLPPEVSIDRVSADIIRDLCQLAETYHLTTDSQGIPLADPVTGMWSLSDGQPGQVSNYALMEGGELMNELYIAQKIQAASDDSAEAA